MKCKIPSQYILYDIKFCISFNLKEKLIFLILDFYAKKEFLHTIFVPTFVSKDVGTTLTLDNCLMTMNLGNKCLKKMINPIISLQLEPSLCIAQKNHYFPGNNIL